MPSRPRLIKDEFEAFLKCGILAHGLLRLRCSECGHDKLLAFSFLERPVIQKILDHRGLDPQPPPKGRVREQGPPFAA